MSDPSAKAGLAPIVRSDAQILILGSLPGDASLAAGRYYAHPTNQFWRLLGDALGCDLAALSYPARYAALVERRIALWDMVATGHRQGSLDAALRVERVQDVAALIATLPRLRLVAFNGGMAARLGARTVPPGNFATLALPSSSAAYTLPYAAKAQRWKQLAALLLPT